MEDIDGELQKLWKREGKQVVEHTLERERQGEIRRLANIRDALQVLLFFAGNGLADTMPLSEALGFLDAEIDSKTPRMDLQEIISVRDFLMGAIGRHWSAKTMLGEVVAILRHEEQRISAKEK